ncbi:ATP-dependent RNA helicase A [Phaffia rhodozyma]|uniref:RNA helicase n=1 Tax=Phaffia rhodozyma TaxID=264483 RepID=A0A0F7SUX6_PHARH|nr:ATP-dependent RNA helicase A [Phaffia rhodozyma]
MAKKKKSALPAVNRGFATSSVPKKVLPPAPVEPPVEGLSQTIDNPNGTDQNATSATHKDGKIGPEGKPKGDGEEDWEKEESYLQSLVEKLQEKVEKEVARTIKTIDFEKRQAKSYPQFVIPESIQERALDLATKMDQANQNQQTLLDATTDIEKILLRLAITHGVLTKIGFQPERIEECLKALSNWDLDEAFDWLYLHCSEDELLQEGDFAPKASASMPATPFQLPSRPASPVGHKSVGPSVPLTPVSETLPSTPAEEIPPPLSQVSVPSSTTAIAPAPVEPTKSLFAPADQEGDDDTSEEDESVMPSLEYAKLRMKLDELIGVPVGTNLKNGKPAKGNKKGQTKNKLVAGKNEPPEAVSVRKKMEVVKAMYLWNKDDAETEYKHLRTKADAKALEDRLKGKVSSPNATTNGDSHSAASPISSENDSNVGAAVTEGSKKAGDLLNGLGDKADDGMIDGLGGLFEQMAAEPSATVPAADANVISRAMPLPKHFTSATGTPKTILQTLAVKLDRFCLVDYATLSNSFHACRASLKIRWKSGREQQWAMTDVGCHSIQEAENFVATMALFELTVVESKGEKGLWRTLPAAYKDFWDELDGKRKEEVDRERRVTWGMLRAILDSRLAPPISSETENEVKPTNKSSVGLIPGFEFLPPPPPLSNLATGAFYSGQIQADFQRRVDSPNYQQMLKQRANLPIASFRETIVSTLESSQVLVLSGETGCGKSTQLPSFLLEDQLSRGQNCRIFVTEPRRISAISLAQRVSQELGDFPNQVGLMSSLVGYSIRLESCTSKNTRLTFVTNGIALRMLEGGSASGGGKGTAFDEITHIIVDEVHERSIESDFLLIVLKTLLEQRKDLKVVLMSATVDAEKISAFFGGCPTLSVPGRTFPVTTQFLEDAIQYSKWFINGDSPYARRYGKYQKGRPVKLDWNEDAMVSRDADDDDDDQQKKEDAAPVKLEKKYEAKCVSTVNILDDRLIPYDLIVRLLEKLCFEDPASFQFSASILIFMPGLNEIRRLNDLLQEHSAFGTQDFMIFPLHSSVSSEGQSAVFNYPPPGVRKIVISTNIAETGVTIPDCVCVIDSGKHREMRFDEKRQISKLVETWIAKSNAAQRRGRAGRVQPGLAFHLFTKLRHETQLQDHPLPEMLRLSLQDLALRIKILKIKMGNSIEEVLSKALDPPLPLNIQRAVSSLVEVKALTVNEDITPMGRLLSKLPMDVHLAALFKCLDPALTIAATLNSKTPFVAPFGLEQEADRAKLSFKTDNSDFLTLHNAFDSWRRASANPNFVRQFCRKNFLSHQNLQQIEELRQQLFMYLVDAGFVEVSDEQRTAISRARYSRRGPRFVTVPPAFDTNSEDTHIISAALASGLFPKILSIDPSSGQLRTFSNNQPASIHPSSVNFRIKTADFGSNHLAFFTIMHSKKLYAWETGPVDDRALILMCGDTEFKLASNLLQLDKKLKLQLHPKTMLALKFLRQQLSSIISVRMRAREMTAEQESVWDLAVELLGKEKDPEGEGVVSL